MNRRPRRASVAMLQRAVAYAALFLIAHAAGLRAYVAVLSGTGSAERTDQMLGLGYLLLYALFVTLVPMLFIAAGLLALGERRRR